MSPSLWPSWWDDVITHMANYQRENPKNLPGAVLAVETLQGGPLIADLGAGWAADTICTIGSMTKTFTATGVLLCLEEHGMLDVDLPVAEFPGMEIYAADPVKRRIQVRHLLQYTSGMPAFLDYTEAPASPCNDPHGPPPVISTDPATLGPTSRWIGSPGGMNELVFARGRCRPTRTATLDEVSEHVMRTYPLVAEPGTKVIHSSANYIVAGRLIERLTGQSPNIYLKNKLFKPLDMRDSFFIAQPTGDADLDRRIDEGVTAEQRARVAETSLITRDGNWPEEIAPGPDGGWDRLRRGWRYVYPDGGMYTTAADLLAYLRMVRDGGMRGRDRILSPAVMKLLATDGGFSHTMGFGFRGTGSPYGQGPGTLDHLGHPMTYFWYDPRPDNPLLGVFLSQRLANAIVNNNMFEGLRAIFREFVPLVSKSSRSAASALAYAAR
jgi:CubicO group peptidase (beta-lactamase class C family)